MNRDSKSIAPRFDCLAIAHIPTGFSPVISPIWCVSLLAAVWMLPAGQASAQTDPPWPADGQCRFTTETIVIDGLLTERAWAEAAPVFFRIPVTHEKPQTRTVGKLCWDAKHLYVALEAEDLELMGLQTERDSTVYKDDVLEIFFQPDPQKPVHYNFEINVRGAYLDGCSGSGGWRWNCEGFRHAVHVRGTINDPSDRDTGWTLEAAIPFAALTQTISRPPAAGDTWRFHLARYDYAQSLPGGKQLSSTAPLTRVNFHYQPDWLPLRFQR